MWCFFRQVSVAGVVDTPCNLLLILHRGSFEVVKFFRRNFYMRGDGTCCYYYTEVGAEHAV
jgi:hypothetical protein